MLQLYSSESEPRGPFDDRFGGSTKPHSTLTFKNYTGSIVLVLKLSQRPPSKFEYGACFEMLELLNELNDIIMP